MKLNLNKSILPLILAAVFPVAVSAQSLTFAYAQTALPLPRKLAPSAITVDGAGYFYYSLTYGDPGAYSSQVFKVPPGGGLPVPVASYAGSTLSIALDAAGNLFALADGQVLKVPLSGGTPTTVGTGFVSPKGLAIDKQQNLYVADSVGTVWKIASDGTGAQTTVPVTGLTDPEAVAVDAAGNLYVAGINISGSPTPRRSWSYPRTGVPR